MNIERFALDAIACNDADVGLDTLKCVQVDLRMLHAALTNPRESMEADAPRFVSQIIARIELALQLAEDPDDEKTPEAAQ